MSRLRYSYLLALQHLHVHMVFQPREVIASRVQYTIIILLNPRDVLNNEVLGSQHVDGAGHPQIKLVLWVISSSMIVKIGMSLTRRPPKEDVYITDFVS